MLHWRRSILASMNSVFTGRPRHCKRIEGVVRVSERQEAIKGWDQKKLQAAIVLLIGAGGANGEVGEGLARKGVGELHICDGDVATTTNLNRQKFGLRDLFKNKAIQLAKWLSNQGFLGTRLFAYPVFSNELDIDAIKPTVIVCSVDLQVQGTRLDICRYGYEKGVPVVFMAVSRDASCGYVMVQQPGNDCACWSCVMKPELLSNEADGEACPGDTGACTNILKATAGMSLYAVDSLIMSCPRTWNFRTLFLATSEFGAASLVKPRPGCPVCGGSRS
jgi:molybdopterin/thiamine biosynthesis adenylyltransferase